MATYSLVNPVFGLAGTATYLVYTYNSGGLVPTDTWSDDGTTLNANPVVLDANGMAKIYVETGKAYRFIYKTAADVTIIDVDPVLVPFGTSGTGTTVTDLTVTNNLDVTNDLTVGGTTNLNGDVNIGGNVTATGDIIGNGIKLTSLAPGHRNGTIDAVIATNAITITYETMASATPSTTDPVSVARRHPTITNGNQTVVNLTAATTLTIPSGATLGCAASEAVRIHIALIRNAGSSLELACWTAAVGTSTGVKTFNPSELVTTVAIGTGSDSAQTVYSTTQRTSQPLVYIGYIEATSTGTAGVWSSVDKIVNWEPGVPLPGDVVQEAFTYTGAVATGTTVLPGDDSIPQITEGDQYMALSVTQKSNLNFIDICTQAYLFHEVVNSSAHCALFKNGAANAIRAGTSAAGTDSHNPCILRDISQAGSTSPVAYTFRSGPASAGTITFNGAPAATRIFGGVDNSYMHAKEIHI